MMNKKVEKKKGYFEQLKKWWKIPAFVVGAVTTIVSYRQMWLGDKQTVTIVTAGIGLALLVSALVWIAYKKVDVSRYDARKAEFIFEKQLQKRFKLARIGLVVFVLIAVAGGVLLVRHRNTQEEKLIVLIAAFEGPEDVYALRNEILESLNAEFAEDRNVEIITTDEVVTVSQGSKYARKLGERRQADIVLWGWYRSTKNPNVHIHIENILIEEIEIVQESNSFKPTISLEDLESATFQQIAGEEIGAFISLFAGYIDFKNGKFELAINHFTEALNDHPDQPFLMENWALIHFYQANSYLLLGNYSSAIEDYEQAISINIEFVEAYNNLGLAFQHLKEYELAIANYSEAIDIYPNGTESYIGRGVSYFLFGEYQFALQDFRRAIKLDSKLAAAYTGLGLVYDAKENYKLAIKEYSKAIDIDCNQPFTFTARGFALYNDKQYELAIRDYESALEVDKNFPAAYFGRGLVYSALDENGKAEEDFSKALMSSPQNFLIYRYRGMAQFDLGNYQLAVDDISRYLEKIETHDCEALFFRGNAYFGDKELYDAILDYSKVIEICPDFSSAYFNRGLIYQQLDEITKAEADFAKYEELIAEQAP